MDLLLRALGVARSVLGVGGKYRAAQLVGLAVAVGWLIVTAANSHAFGLSGHDDRPVSVCSGDLGTRADLDGTGSNGNRHRHGDSGTLDCRVDGDRIGSEHRATGQRNDVAVAAPVGPVLVLAGADRRQLVPGVM